MFTPRDYATIVLSLRQKFAGTFPELTTQDGSVPRIGIIDPIGLELQQIEALLKQVQDSQSLLTATGVDLDLLAFNYNVQRRDAQKASGYVQFYIAQSSLTDPIAIDGGTIITSTDNVQYETLLDAVLNGFAQQSVRDSIPVYEITVPVSAIQTGSAGNALSGTLTTTTIQNVNVTNDAIVEGGYEQEPDDSLAQRCILSFGVWSRGTKKAVEYGARLIPGVYYARAVTDYAGHFTLFVSDKAGNLSNEMRQAVFDIMVDWAGAGNGWTVVQPPIFLLNTNIKVIFKSQFNINTQLTQVQQDIATIINASNDSTIYIDDLIVAIKNKLSSYVLHFDLDAPVDHIVKPVGTVIRSGTIVATSVTT